MRIPNYLDEPIEQVIFVDGLYVHSEIRYQTVGRLGYTLLQVVDMEDDGAPIIAAIRRSESRPGMMRSQFLTKGVLIGSSVPVNGTNIIEVGHLVQGGIPLVEAKDGIVHLDPMDNAITLSPNGAAS